MHPSPLLEFFKRGEVARDVRILAAQGALAPRAHEQLSILIVLLDDPDPEVRGIASGTLDRIPEAAIAAFLARPDVSIDLRAFFGDRGILPAVSAATERDAPLVDTGGPDVVVEDEADDRQSLTAKVAAMGFTERLKAAMKGSREVRAILVRDPNKMLAAAVLSSPKLTEQEVESIARMASVSEDVLRIIASTRSWMKNYKIVSALTRNPKSPVAVTLNLLQRLSDRDLGQLSVDRNVPEPLRVAARKKVVAGASKR
jgi:hypothetical protein